MPQRFLKPGITSSQRWEACSWMAQSFYIRLITLVDDFGRYDATPNLLRSHAFPIRDDIKASKVVELCQELSIAGLVIFYESAGKQYLQITNWNERARSEKSKFPDPAAESCAPLRNPAESCGILPPSSSSSPLVLVIDHMSGKPDVSPVEKFTGARVLLHYLNEKAGRHFQERGDNLKVINARLEENSNDLEGAKLMVDRQCARWKGDPKMDEYLRISTLFAKSNFHEYYDNRHLPVVAQGSAKPTLVDKLARELDNATARLEDSNEF